MHKRHISARCNTLTRLSLTADARAGNTLSGTLRTYGRNFRLCTRVLVTSPDGVIDASESDQDELPDKKGKADSATQAGQPGTSGKQGLKGGDGGSVIILAGRIDGKLTIRANGGKGGLGQSGGNGAPGTLENHSPDKKIHLRKVASKPLNRRQPRFPGI
jgi:hypothetical protein